ncbi:MAG: pectin acetylesterase-family hydrolase, partial [Bacteroidota bacterium]
GRYLTYLFVSCIKPIGMILRPYLLIFSVIILFSCSKPKTEEATTSAPDPFANMDPYWNKIEPGGESICSTGTPYAFYFHPGDSKKVMVYFDGGGACWFRENCDPKLKTITHTPFVIDSIDNPGLKNAGITGASWGGIFDLDNPENPVKDYSILMIPYCTADTHLGAKMTTYRQDTLDPQTIDIHHKGYINTMAALNWLNDRIDNPEKIFVTGVSAGSLASPVYTGYLAGKYPNARVVQLGDASGGYQSKAISDIFSAWGGAQVFDSIYPDRDTTLVPNFENYFRWAQSACPNVRFSQYNAAFDDVQAFFLGLLGEQGKTIDQTILENTAYLEKHLPEFRHYIDSGKHHGLIIRDQFYTTTINGVKFKDWFTSLIDGEPVENVVCDSCYD